ncbi:MAG: hypothetical protein MZV70_12665 [Desulfobacterales bacterium]|nr:hypothetical protein [Desulfobacterales bacterium]
MEPLRCRRPDRTAAHLFGLVYREICGGVDDLRPVRRATSRGSSTRNGSPRWHTSRRSCPKIDWQFLFVIGIFFGALTVVDDVSILPLAGRPFPRGRHASGRPSRSGPWPPLSEAAVAMFGARLADG